jgi:VanZ family protein
LRPITAVPHKLEHIAIFSLWGIAFSLCYRINLFYQIMGAVLFAGAIEIAQYWIPGRHARISDFVIDAAAACASILLTRIFVGALTTWFNRSSLIKH